MDHRNTCGMNCRLSANQAAADVAPPCIFSRRSEPALPLPLSCLVQSPDSPKRLCMQHGRGQPSKGGSMAMLHLHSSTGRSSSQCIQMHCSHATL